MGHIFISYKQERRAFAERLAVVLEAYGYDVWWDYRLVAGENFRRAIEDKILEASAVLVLWCQSAVDSNFVVDEAELGRRNQKLLQATIELVDPPMGFRSLDHRLNLVGWPGNPDHELVDGLLQGIELLTKQRRRTAGLLVRTLASTLGALQSGSPSRSEAADGSDEEPTADSVTSSAPALNEIEHTFFKSCSTAAELEVYLRQYPGGHFADLARTKIQTLDQVWLESLGLVPSDWSIQPVESILQKIGPRGARAELEPRARRGVPEALTLLGVTSGLSGDKPTEFRLLSEASAMGFPRAIRNLALQHIDGGSAPLDVPRATALFRQAAELGNGLAQFNFAVALKDGTGVETDTAAAASWMRRAAEQGYNRAQRMLGNLYRDGIGLPRSAANAAKWYRLAAESGEPIAQRLLAIALLKGDGVEKNTEEAMAWLKKAADSGNSIAQYRLGLMYETGEGTAINKQAALQWYASADKLGHKQASAARAKLAAELARP